MTRIYLDNAASTPIDPEVLDVMIDVWRNCQGNPSSVHHHGRQLRTLIERSRKEIAELIGAAPAEVFFTSGGTEADNMAIKGAACSLGIGQIISTPIEHHAVTHAIEDVTKAGKIRATWLPVDGEGFPSLVALESALKQGPKALVTLMHANNELGTLIDLEAVSAICKKHDAYLHSDTVQSMAHVRYKVSDMHLHFLTASAHKFYGPQGIGLLYVKAGTQIQPLISGGSQERNMRAGTEDVASIVGMAHALKRCYGRLEEKNAHLWNLKRRMKAGLERLVPGVQFNGPTDEAHSLPTVLNVAFPSDELESMLLFNLDINGISASGGSACTSGSVKGSHVLEGIGCSPARMANSVRFSFGVQNTEAEIDMALEKIAQFLPVQA